MGEFVTLIPGSSNMAKGINIPSYYRFADTYSDWTGKKYPYCKLEFISSLYQKCQSVSWIESNINDLIYVYFSMIFDRGLLFAQTREKSSARNAPTYRDFKTNLDGTLPKDKENIVDKVICELIDKLGLYIDSNATKLTRNSLRQALDAVIADWRRPQKGRPRELLRCPQNQKEELCYRERGESEEAWATRQERSLYEMTYVLGIPAQSYYREHCRELGLTEDMWREVVIKWLNHLDRGIKQIKCSRIRYKPFFLPSQTHQFEQFQDDVTEYEQCFKQVVRFKEKIQGDSKGLKFSELIPLPNRWSNKAKLEQFAQTLSAQETPSPQVAGILFLLRAHLHPILSGRRGHSYPTCLSSVSVRDGCKFFNCIQENMMECLPYSACDLLSIDNICIHAEDVEREFQVLKPYVQQEVANKLKPSFPLRKQYKKLFFHPVYQRELLKEVLQKIVGALDWTRIPLNEALNRKASFTSTSPEKYSDALAQSLVEYVLLEELIQQGYQELEQIAHNIFLTVADN